MSGARAPGEDDGDELDRGVEHGLHPVRELSSKHLRGTTHVRVWSHGKCMEGQVPFARLSQERRQSADDRVLHHLDDPERDGCGLSEGAARWVAAFQG